MESLYGKGTAGEAKEWSCPTGKLRNCGSLPQNAVQSLEIPYLRQNVRECAIVLENDGHIL